MSGNETTADVSAPAHDPDQDTWSGINEPEPENDGDESQSEELNDRYGKSGT